MDSIKKKLIFGSFCVGLIATILLMGGVVNIANAQTPSHVFGWAWGATDEGPEMGVGWVKFNSCNDNDLNGQPDPGSCGSTPYSVQISRVGNQGTLSGHAWSNNIGWISFNRSETGNPPSDDPGNGTGPIATVDFSGTSGTFRGWAKALAGNDLEGWDGWIHLSDNSTAPSRHPSGPSYTSGNGGVTYNQASASIVGSAWGSDVIGWLKFYNVTYGTPTGSFDYSLSNSGNVTVEAGESALVQIFRTLTSGVPQNTTITISTQSITPSPNGVTVTALGTNNPCLPTCQSDLSITTTQNAPEMTYTVRVTSTPGNKQTTFELKVEENSSCPEPPCGTGGPTNLSCTLVNPPPQSQYQVNQDVTWRVAWSGGEGPFTVDWAFTNLPSLPFTKRISNATSPSNTIVTYPKVGKKEAQATVTDNQGRFATCALISADVVVSPFIKEN